MDLFKVTCDDFGYCTERNRGILELVKLNIAQNVSVIINGTYAVPIDPNLNKNLKIGLHVNLTEGKPISRSECVTSLIGSDLMLFGKFGLREKLMRDEVLESDIAREIEEQIKKFISIYGHTPNYMDGHQHIHVHPKIVKLFMVSLTKYGIIETRIPYELNIIECGWIDQPRFKFYQEVCQHAKEAKKYIITNNISYPTYFIGFSTMSRDMTIERFRRSLELVYDDYKMKGGKTSPRFIEFMVHPGYPSNNYDGGCGNGPDEFSCSSDRRYELDVLKSNEFRELLARFQHTFLTDTG